MWCVGAGMWSGWVGHLATNNLRGIHFTHAKARVSKSWLYHPGQWHPSLCHCFPGLLWSLVQEPLCTSFCNSKCSIITVHHSVGYNELYYLFFKYFIFVALLCLAELLTGILGFFYSDAVTSTLQQELLTGIQDHYNASSQDGFSLAWDHIQHQVISFVCT